MSVSTKKIDTESFANILRDRSINVESREILISILAGSDQEADLSEPVNCGGLGRIRHFKQETAEGWPPNPLPIVPAMKALGEFGNSDKINAQVFQNAACPWRCWYCFVPYNLLSANEKKSKWVTSEELIEHYLAESEPARIIDLSGGSPDLVPEWSVWMVEALQNAGLDNTTYLWSDDNLSTTYLFDKLTPNQLDRLQEYENYGRVCCFKGFDEASFSFNTQATSEAFDNQFKVMARNLELDIDLYGYLTLTATTDAGIKQKMSDFVDKLQALKPNLPLRVVPLRIGTYGPVLGRMTEERERSLAIQETAISCWNEEIESRFKDIERNTSICEVKL